MNMQRFEALLLQWTESSLTEAEWKELNEFLRDSPEARSRFRAEAALNGILYAAANKLAMESAIHQTFSEGDQGSKLRETHFLWRNFAGVLVGLIVGIAGVSILWGLARPIQVATSKIVPTLNNESFEEPMHEFQTGFPNEFGTWGGDEVEVVTRELNSQSTNRFALRFANALSDSGNPNSRAIACDLFQVVDLRSIPRHGDKRADFVLELTASVSDQRLANSQPSVTFFCQLYLFRGNLSNASNHWPEAIHDAIATASSQHTTLGESGWQPITARCLVPDQVDFAVVHLAARPNMRVPMPDHLFVDDVKLVARIQPILPVRGTTE